MRVRMLLGAVPLVLVFSLAPPGQTATAICVVPNGGLNPPSYHHNCRYTATGPGWYVAPTVNAWRIMASDDGGFTFTVLAEQLRPGHPEAGMLATTVGQIIDASIGCGPAIPMVDDCSMEGVGVLASGSNSP
ncbi:MAG: hypothetical protein ABR548_08655 [Actinomycetota bacterium]|nr:hypothetical protein [Actinomycetota bacterium]